MSHDTTTSKVCKEHTPGHTMSRLCTVKQDQQHVAEISWWQGSRENYNIKMSKQLIFPNELTQAAPVQNARTLCTEGGSAVFNSARPKLLPWSWLATLDFQLYLGPRNANLSGGYWALDSAWVPRSALLALLECQGTVPLTVRTLSLPASPSPTNSSSSSPVQQPLLHPGSIPLSLFWTSDMPVPLNANQLLSWKGKQSIPIHFPRILQTSFLFVPQFLHM